MGHLSPWDTMFFGLELRSGHQIRKQWTLRTYSHIIQTLFRDISKEVFEYFVYGTTWKQHKRRRGGGSCLNLLRYCKPLNVLNTMWMQNHVNLWKSQHFYFNKAGFSSYTHHSKITLTSKWRSDPLEKFKGKWEWWMGCW